MNKIWTLGLSVAIALFSCTDPDLIGLEIQPESDKITLSTLYEDGAFLSLSSIEEDSVKSDENTVNLLGAYTDPVFGDRKASFSTQLLLSESAVDFGENPTLVSAVLYLTHTGYYGDSTQQMEIEVARLDESIYVDSSYYSNELIPATDVIATHSFYPYGDEPDSLGKYTLQIELDALGEDVLDAKEEYLTDNTAFVEYLKGIQVRTTNMSGSIVYFNLKDVASKLTITYNDSLTFDLVMSSAAARINHFEQDHNLTSELAAESMGGYNLKVDLSEAVIDSLKTDLAAKPINKATLTFYQTGETENLVAHNSLSLVRVDSTGSKLFLTDFFEGSEHFGGDLEDHQYTFNISKHLSQLLNGELDVEDLYLMPIGASVNANRTLFTGEVELNITYTEF